MANNSNDLKLENHGLHREALVLIVDDENQVIEALKRSLRVLPIRIFQASDAEVAKEILCEEKIDLLISDMRMPGTSGAELMQWSVKHSPSTYRIVLTGFSELSSVVDAINLGQVHRFIEKPWSNNELVRIVKVGLKVVLMEEQNDLLQKAIAEKNQALADINTRLEAKVEQRTKQIKLALNKVQRDHKATEQVLYNFIGIHPLISGEFAMKVQELSVNIAVKANVDETDLEHIRLASLLSEIGKLGLADHLVTSPLNKLNIKDREAFYSQVDIAGALLLPATHLNPVTNIIAQQYEHWSGEGYPHILQGEDIHVGARIIAVARDFWRYIDGSLVEGDMDFAMAIEKIREKSGKQYDPSIVSILDSSFDSLLNEKLGTNVSSKELVPGMVLTKGLLSVKNLLILPEGHVFSNSSIEKLVQFEKHQKTNFTIEVNLPPKI